MALSNREREAYMAECRDMVIDEIRRMIPGDPAYRTILYDLVLDYPLRSAKALRPSLCIAMCRALGGMLEAVLPSAAVLELYHNAFLIHDDIEDDSLQRRGLDTLHRVYGVPIAINVGDTMLAMALEPLLDNMRVVGMGKALRVLRTIAKMARESAEGQAIELDWVRRGTWLQNDEEYATLVTKKSAWYTFVTPFLVGAYLADMDPSHEEALVRLGTEIGIAFQIQDDVLNIAAATAQYGKERAGDLWEGKHTLILMHLFREASAEDRARATAILAKPRAVAASHDDIGPLIAELEASGDLTARGRSRLAARRASSSGGEAKTDRDVEELIGLIERYDSLQYARRVAQLHAEHARGILAATQSWLGPSAHRDFIESMLDYVVTRDR